ncbi:MAG: FAD-dependent oxidoreductase [Mycoplasma sp.]|nr:FAD-dependent oxidoreductase [Mycoplasma sp.]
MKIVIIGGVASGAATATKLRRNIPNAEIKIFEKSKNISFANCGLVYGITGEAETNNLIVFTAEALSKKFNVEVNVKHEVIKINEKEKTVEVKDLINNKTFVESYDKLVLAMGAGPLKLPVKNLYSEKNVFYLRTFEDMMYIKENLNDSHKNILVIGTGFVGIEMAEGFQKMGKNVTMVEMADRIMGYDIDMTSFIYDELVSNNIEVILKTAVESIDIDKKEAKLSSGKIVKYDAIMTTGISPNTKILDGTNIEKDNKGIVKTNDYMQTTNPNIYAAGDIVYTPHVVLKKKTYLPFAHNAKVQAKVVADHIAGNLDSKQESVTGASVIRVFSKTVAKVGITEQEAKQAGYNYHVSMITTPDIPKYIEGSSKMVLKMVIDKDKRTVLGLQGVGSKVDKRIDVASTIITAGMTIDVAKTLNLCYSPHYSKSLDPINIITKDAIQKIKNQNIEQFSAFNIPEGALILDVRPNDGSREEKGALPNSVPLEINDFSEETLPKDKNKEIYVFCNSGFTSTIASTKLSILGYKKIKNIIGGNNLYQNIKKMYKK